MKKKPKIGLALGAGSARGLAHIGVLRVLQKNKIIPDYIAGTSMGAVVGAAYAAGRSVDDIEEIAKTTNWKSVVDFAIPKAGLIQGEIVEARIRQYVYNKSFKDLSVPLSIVAYNLTKKEKVVFHNGDLTSAVRASISIPGIFAPLEKDSTRYIDGGVVDPTPFDVVREMGADIVIAVDLSSEEGRPRKHVIKKSSLFIQLRRKFVLDELLNIKRLIFPEEWPRFIRSILVKLFDKILYPARVLRMLFGRELLPVTRTLYETIQVLSNNLASARLKCAEVDVLVRPSFGKLRWYDFDEVKKYAKIGEIEMEKNMPKLTKLLKS